MGAIRLISTSLGTLRAEASARGVCRLGWVGRGACESSPVGRHDRAARILANLANELEAYARGEPVRFAVPLDLSSGTAFQQQVWRALARVPWGRAVSYGGLAHTIRAPRAARAVGAACGANPVAIVVPCHRVLAAVGRLGGFSSGLARKRRLLRLEGIAYRE